MQQTSQTQPDHDGAYPPARRAWFALLAVSLAYVVSFIDRQAISLLAEPIRRDLGLTDMQLGLLQGFAFATVYVLAGLPIGRWVDQYNRRNIIVVGVLFWSLMTGACGLAGSFVVLLLCRAGVGVGEAALSPAAYSQMSDYFRPGQLPAAMSIYSLAPAIGSGLAFLLGGALLSMAGGAHHIDFLFFSDVRPWQATFLVLGLLGLPLALLLLCVQEPQRRGRAGVAPGSGASFRQTLQFLRSHADSVGAQLAGMALIGLVSYGVMTWYPTMIVRTHGEDVGRVGMVLGPLMIAGSIVGNLAGAWGATILARRGHRAPYVKWVAIAAFGTTIVGVLAPLIPSLTGTYAAVAVMAIMTTTWNGPAMAALHLAVPNGMRGQMTAIALLCMNLIGLSLGPMAVAALTQYVFADPQSLRYSLAIVSAAAGAVATIMLGHSWRRYVATPRDEIPAPVTNANSP